MIDTVKTKFDYFLRFINPVKGIVLFLFLFLFFELLWKLCIHLVPDETQFIFLGQNLTNFVHPLCELDAKIVYWFIHDLLGYSDYKIEGTHVYFDVLSTGNLRQNIIWSCTSLKQWLLFTFIMIFYYGPYKKKLVFIPLSLIFLGFINILRLVITAFIIKDGFPEWFIPINEIMNGVTWSYSRESYWVFYHDWFHLFHDGFFKWVYYDGILFMIWLFWQEKINLPFQRAKQKKSE